MPAAFHDECLWCGEPILDDERFERTTLISKEGASPAFLHWECSARRALGSVAHQQQRCYCYGGDGEDDPDLTRRQAAKAALDFARTWIDRHDS